MFKNVMLCVMSVLLVAGVFIVPKAEADRRDGSRFEYVGRASYCDVYTTLNNGHRIFVTMGGTGCAVSVD